MFVTSIFPGQSFFVVTADPNGTFSGARGSIAIRVDVGNESVWLNTDGATAWVQLGTSVSGGGWTDAGVIVRLTTATDVVGIGTAAPVAGRKLHVLQTAANQGVRSEVALAGNVLFDGMVTADAGVRMSLTTAALGFGDGTGAVDWSLTRTGALTVEVTAGTTTRLLDNALLQLGTTATERFTMSSNGAGSIRLETDAITGAAGMSSRCTVVTGDAIMNAAGGPGPTSGTFAINTGNTDCTDAGGTAGGSGAITITTGSCMSTLGLSGASGGITATTGNSADANTGGAGLTTGNATLGSSGGITLQTGTAAVLRGSITLNALSVILTTPTLDSSAQVQQWSLFDNNIAALQIGSAGALTTMVFSTVNGDEQILENYARTAVGSAHLITATVNSAGNILNGLRVGVAAVTTGRNAATTTGVHASTTSLAADINSAFYSDFRAGSPTDGGGSAIHAAFFAEGGHDRLLDGSSAATGENVVRIPATVADAWSLQNATVVYHTVNTTANSQQLNGALVDINAFAIQTGGIDHTTRLTLTEDFRRLPQLVGSLANDNANKDWLLEGTGVANGDATFSTGGGVLLNAAGVQNDQAIIRPHTAAGQTMWAATSWRTQDSIRWKFNMQTGNTITASRYAAGLKVSLPAGVTAMQNATDLNQVFFGYSTDGEYTASLVNWVAVVRIGGASANVDTAVGVATNSNLRFVIDVDATLIARFYIDGILRTTTGALTNAINFIPFAGVQTLDAGGAASTIIVQRKSSSKVYV